MSKYVVGVDVGGTTVKLGMFTVDGEVISKWEIPTRTEDDGSHILPDIADSIKREIVAHNFNAEDFAGVGIGVPGPVDDKGVVHKAVNLGWQNEFSIVETMKKLLPGMTVRGGNDANVAALGEMWKGGGQGCENLVAVTLGTGVGGGIIVGGRLLNGSTGAGGEIGHIHIEDNETEACGCGNYGCLEEYASATGIVRLARRELEASSDPSSLRDGEVSAKTVFDAVKAGDTLAIRVAEAFGEYLGKGLAIIAGVVNPEVFVIGGGVSKAGEILFDYIRPAFERTVFHGSRDTRFALATLGNDAGIYGAAKLILGNAD
ncbi:MAG: ROK family glucokinase [Lachnospiraceae bacterium]|nr:ROK family glucokinase [Lachnospiraceae bacterium]